ncbi:transposase, MuDR, MULE transposase domain protein [Tanacetum coccineum]
MNRLPVKSLLQFRTVSKSWKYSIDCSDFVREYGFFGKNTKLIHEKYNHRSETHIGGSSSQTHEIDDVYLTAEELHQLHLDEEALRETLEEQTMDEKAREEKIRQKQVDDDEYFMEFGMNSNFSNENDPWEYSLDIDDSDLHLTPVLRSSSSAHKVVKDVGEDADFNSGAWVSATNYVNAFGGTVTGCLGGIDNFLKKGKLEQVVAIVKSCSPNALGDLNVTLKDLSGTVPGTIHYKVLDVSSYEKDITIGAAMILANVSVFTPKPSKHYLNITKRNVVEVFRKDTVSLA